MGIVSKQAIKGSIYIYIGVIVGFVTSGILMPKLPNVLPLSDF